MNEENKKKVWKLIQKTGDELKGKLPEHPSHPKGRNPYAHIALEIKNYFGMSYSDISDERIPELEKFIFYIRDNPKYQIFRVSTLVYQKMKETFF